MQDESLQTNAKFCKEVNWRPSLPAGDRETPNRQKVHAGCCKLLHCPTCYDSEANPGLRRCNLETLDHLLDMPSAAIPTASMTGPSSTPTNVPSMASPMLTLPCFPAQPPGLQQACGGYLHTARKQRTCRVMPQPCTGSCMTCLCLHRSRLLQQLGSGQQLHSIGCLPGILYPLGFLVT